ncbi:hypothetical protein EPA93_12620 [Ktedonosporobacter rubrisoli]|uniref:Uncharacterized protein n=1 Tax=Ktedonosporobacter rubrisoli TaxID=2509675 RepID=A0A4V0YYN1_KTERU|nr:hypothetical protein [Ktedonosporobacter rubrisoli]QBD76801.1 hypothetical protein EPA93_12620 [Ktedonosporobacter rubrisoli]
MQMRLGQSEQPEDKQTSPHLKNKDANGWSAGLLPMWRQESRLWWGHLGWLKSCVIWLILINGFQALVLSDAAGKKSFDVGEILFELNIVSLMFYGIGTILAGQGKIIDDKQSQIVSWLLSKPLSRVSFILSKYAALTGMLPTMILLPSLVTFILIYLRLGVWATPSQILLTILWEVVVVLLLYSLTLLLGTLFMKRSLVAGIGIISTFILMQLEGSRWLQPVMKDIADGQALRPGLAMVGLFLVAALLAVLAIVRFKQSEL